MFGPSAGFFADLTRAAGERLVADLDYVGLDFFPDVFRPVAAGRLEDLVQDLLGEHRRDILTPAGLGHLPLVVTEHGWPTGPGRPAERQAEVLRSVCQFGLMTDDYVPKPAFHAYRNLIEAMTAGAERAWLTNQWGSSAPGSSGWPRPGS